MKKNKIIEYFQFNLFRLKNWVNKTPKEEIEEISLIVFNHLINQFPNDNWHAIKSSFEDYTDIKSPQWVVNYTILAYYLGPTYTESHPLFSEDLCDILTNYKTSPYKLAQFARFFLNSHIYSTIIKALRTKGIPPKYIIKLTLENFNLNEVSSSITQKIYHDIIVFVNDFDYQIFSGNYSFFNIYRCLKKLWDNYIILELPTLNFQDIELLLEFENIPDAYTKNKIHHDFSVIEKKETSIAEKFQDCLTIISHYSYDLPSYLPSRKIYEEK